MFKRRPYRSFLSYIDLSREYYAAHGYSKPYKWISNQNAPFTDSCRQEHASEPTKHGADRHARRCPRHRVGGHVGEPSDLASRHLPEGRQRSDERLPSEPD